MTGRHRGPKQKLRSGYWASSPNRTSCPKLFTQTHLICCDVFSSSCVVSHTFSALCRYSKFWHHPHSLGYFCAKFHFFRGLRCWASPRRKIAYSLTYSITHPAYLMPWNQSFHFRISKLNKQYKLLN